MEFKCTHNGNGTPTNGEYHHQWSWRALANGNGEFNMANVPQTKWKHHHKWMNNKINVLMKDTCIITGPIGIIMSIWFTNKWKRQSGESHRMYKNLDIRIICRPVFIWSRPFKFGSEERGIQQQVCPSNECRMNVANAQQIINCQSTECLLDARMNEWSWF